MLTNYSTHLAKICNMTAGILAVALLAPGSVHAANIGSLLDQSINGAHRSEANRARDRYRHPKETLLFFGLKPEMTVAEISPAAGWYTEIIAPVLKNQGKYYAAVPKVVDQMPESMKRRDSNYRAMLASDPNLYSSATIVTYDAASPEFGPKASSDMALTFRNVHNWAKAGNAAQMFSGFFNALRKGGILGVVEHRAAPGTSFKAQIDSGYMTEAYVIQAATQAGFKLLASSDINNNSLDTKDHPGGVWNLPPNLRDVPEQDRARYLAIGESDRMTLKFVKP